MDCGGLQITVNGKGGLWLLLFLPTFPYLLADISFGSCASFDLNKEEPAVLTKGAKQFVQNPWESSLNSFMNTEP